MEDRICRECGSGLPAGRRKYCSRRCGRRSWRRALRRASSGGTPPHLDHWIKQTDDVAAARAAYNTDMAVYMRLYRRERRP
jgi:hypothetical protein